MDPTTPTPVATPDEKTYRTSDLYYAAFLKVAGVRFVEAVREGKRTHFVFEHQEGLRALKNQYYSRAAVKFQPLTYADEIKTLKTLTYADRG
jgi:hypothetical protein